LESQTQRARDKAPLRKFSTLVRRMVVELERDPTLYPDGNVIEWPHSPGPHNPALDGFTIKRTGDAPTKVRIVLYLDHCPEQFKIAPELGNVLGIKEESRMGAVMALWNYIKIQGLQDKVDRRMVRADNQLRPIFNADSLPFQKLPEIVNRFLLVPDPIVIQYYIEPTQIPPGHPSAWDVEVKLEDSTLKSRTTAMLQMSKESAQDLTKLDEEIALHAQSLHNAYTKRAFLQSFASDPVQFIHMWLESQSSDLETILGSGFSEGAMVRAEELRRSEFFKLPWVEEAVAVQEGMRFASKGMT